MNFDFQPYFNRYNLLAKAADRVFEQVQSQFPKEIECKLECSDCCHAVFDVTLIEALYLNHQFCKHFSGKEREAILEKANRADRQAYKLKRAAYQKVEEGKDESEILIEMAGERIRCPLLNAQDRCDLYEYRPVTCRFYGVPTEIAGIAHTCGKSGFIKGKSYPTVHLEKMQKNLFALSFEIAKDIQSKFTGLGEILVPVSMALLTDYNEEYLGIKLPETSEKEGGGKMEKESTETLLSDEEERKKAIFNTMSPRRQKHVLKMGYEKWDPFQEPKDPIDMRGDKMKRTSHMLVREFLQSQAGTKYGNEYARGVLDLCLGVINEDERYIGMFDFSCWYQDILKKDAMREK